MSAPERNPAWGSGNYPGNCDGGLLRDLVLHYRPGSVADPMEGSGTARDVVESLNREKGPGIVYWGSDLHRGFDLRRDRIPGKFDMIWLHPPYWNIIRYSQGRKGDLSCIDSYPAFLRALEECLVRCHRALAPGGRLAILVGDVRRRGAYVPIVRDILNLEGRIGELRSILIKEQHNCRSDRKSYGRMEDVPIRHEYCTVFKRVR